MDHVKILGIDPGIQGALVLVGGSELVAFFKMPILVSGKVSEIDFDRVFDIVSKLENVHVFLERAMPMAMGSKHAFNYGRGFAALEIAIKLAKLPVTYVEPSKWVKEIHAGISADLKPKAKSMIAIERLFPHLVPLIPKSKTGKLDEGIVEAILIAEYGRRSLGMTKGKQL